MLWVGAGPFGLDIKGGPGAASRKSLWSLTGAGLVPSPRVPCSPLPVGSVCAPCAASHSRHGRKHRQEGEGVV